MSRVPGSVHPLLRHLTRAAMVPLAAVTLSACGTPTTSTPRVDGVPSISVSVPLETVACTLHDSCVAVGSLAGSLGPPTIGEYRNAGGRWLGLTVPSTPSAVITSASCWTTGCLIVGAQPSGDLVWRYDSSTRSVSTPPAPRSSLGVSVVSCYAELSCAVVDTGSAGTPQLLLTGDGGSTWTTPLTMTWAGGDSVTGLACRDEFACVASATSSTGLLNFESTSDGGVTWATVVESSTWTSLRSLTCWGPRCAALATTQRATRFVRTKNFGRTWSSLSLPESANTLACTTFAKCVVAGQTGSQAPWIARVHRGVLSAVSLRYVPTPVIDAACGTRVCAAIGPTTLMVLAP